MKKIIATILISILSFLYTQFIYADVKLPAIVSSNMVLQRNTTIELWGWADAGEHITITTSWLDGKIETRADKHGNWQVKVATTGSKAAQKINIGSALSNITLNNVLFGEVWLCSGQSNMRQPLKGYEGQPTYGGNMAIAKSPNPNLRLFTVHKLGFKTPLKDLQDFTPWQEASPNSVMDFSAVAYFFGQQLQEILDVPVGLIHTSWGGSVVQAWMSYDVLEKYQEINLGDVDITERTNHIPTALFNAMINPIIPYTIKGALWYQGESNLTEPWNYKELFPAMVKDWRSRWELGNFPFYFVQIAPYLYGNGEAFQGVENSAFIREAQLKCVDLIPNSGIAITMDIGDADCIHPPKKKEVADRLLFNALNRTYGYTAVDYQGPIFDSQEANDSGITLKFKNVETGLFSQEELNGFEIAGSDKIFYPAKAKIINGKEVFVKSDKVPNPLAVRYAWDNWIIGTLYDTNLLPASSFRTDDWDDATRAK